MNDNVVIAGAGPVGLMCALGLARQGVTVDIFEAEQDVVYSPRAIGYAWPILKALESWGLLDDMMAAGHVEHERCWRVFATGETIVFDHSAIAGDTSHPYSLTLGQHLIARVLLAHLAREPNVRVHWSHAVAGLTERGDRIVVAVNGPDGAIEVDASWVIAADGGRSTVRKAIGLPLEGFTWERRFVATDVYFDFEGHGWQSCYLIDPEFGTVVYKLNEDRLWRVTYAEDRRLPVESALERMPAFMARILPGDGRYELSHWSPYNMHQRTAPTYRKGRVLLAGDAAHLTNPTSGFGLMGGLYDAFLLTEALGAVVTGKGDDSLLDRYAAARRSVYLDVTSPVSTESLRLCFDSRNEERLAWDLRLLRERMTDPQAMHKFLSIPRALETPSLLTGKSWA